MTVRFCILLNTKQKFEDTHFGSVGKHCGKSDVLEYLKSWEHIVKTFPLTYTGLDDARKTLEVIRDSGFQNTKIGKYSIEKVDI